MSPAAPSLLGMAKNGLSSLSDGLGRFFAPKPGPKAERRNSRGNEYGMGRKPKPAFPLTGVDGDASPEGYDSEWTPEQRGLTIPERSDERRAIAALITKRLEAAARHREPLLRQWLECLAYTRGFYWMGWDMQGRFVSRKDMSDPYRSYCNVDLVTPELQKLTARVLSGKPDASTKPFTTSERDRDAAAEGRSILAHCDRKFDRPSQNVQAYLKAQVFGGAFRKLGWDHNAEAEVVTEIDPETGEILESVFAPVGDVFERIYSHLDILFDPKAEHYEEGGYLLEVSAVSLSYVHEKFKDCPYARYVKGGIPKWYENSLANLRTATTGQMGGEFDLWDGEEAQGMCLLAECWEKPSDRYPTGRLITVANDEVLRYEEWPYEKKDAFPYAYLPYHINVGCAYADGVVGQLLPLVQEYNLIRSRLMDRLNTDFPVIAADKGCQFGVDAFTSPRNYKFIFATPGRKWEYVSPPPVPQYWFQELDRIEQKIKAICGTSISDGNTPPGVTAASAIELFVTQDNSQGAEYYSNVEQYHCRGAEWEIALYQQFAKELRLMAVSDQPGMDAQADAMAFYALRNGGRCRVSVTAGSAIPKTPAAMKQEAFDRFIAGVYAPVGTPENAKGYWDAIDAAKSETMTDNYLNGVRRMEEAAQKQAELEAQIKAGEPVDPEADIMKEMALRESDQNHQFQLKTEEIDRKAEAQMAVDEHRGRVDLQKSQAEAQMGMERARMDARLGVASEWAKPPPPKPNFATGSGKKPAPKPRSASR